MEKIEISNKQLNEKYFHYKHPSGLNIYLYPKKGYSSIYAIFGTNFGSINNKFKIGDSSDVIQVPDGIAHYLEHKLFESEDGDAFSKYAKTGASANAYTSFEKTAYLFSCSKNFEESLKILINFVQSPYFTEETVKKEQGIIGQEIKMYEDDPEWRALFNVLNAMYNNHPVKIDIAGTVESIAKITPDYLYKCYNAFYNLNNMSLCIAGNIDIENTLSIIDKELKPSKPTNVETILPQEPYSIVKDKVEEEFDIMSPIFYLGFKGKSDNLWMSEEKAAYIDIILIAVASKSSDLYSILLEKGLINTASFSYEHFEGPGYSSILFSGESKDPDEVAKIIREYLSNLLDKGLDEETFIRAKKVSYGSYVKEFNSVSALSNEMLNNSFNGRELFKSMEYVSKAKLEKANMYLKEIFNISKSSLSIAKPRG